MLNQKRMQVKLKHFKQQINSPAKRLNQTPNAIFTCTQ